MLIPKVIYFEKMSVINAPITYNIENGTKDIEKYKSVIAI